MSAARGLRLLIFGAPGSGKGTIAGWIQRDYGVPQVSSGDLLRRHISDGTEIGKQAKDIVSQGGLVPDAMMISLILSELRGGSGWLLDGFPRTLPQAQALSSALSDASPAGSGSINLVIHVDVPPETIIGRVRGRLVHVPSGRVYNTDFSPPKTPMIDDVTGEPLTKRPDDDPDFVRKRLQLFAETSEPVLSFYRSQGLLAQFKGETSKDIYKAVQERLSLVK